MLEVMRIVAETAQDKVKKEIEGLPNHNFNESNVQNIFNTAYALAGLVAVVFIIYGGSLYITSAGDAAKAAKARATIIWAVVGLVIVLLAAAITAFVISALTGGE